MRGKTLNFNQYHSINEKLLPVLIFLIIYKKLERCTRLKPSRRRKQGETNLKHVVRVQQFL
jgi:hypothetical protein